MRSGVRGTRGVAVAAAAVACALLVPAAHAGTVAFTSQRCGDGSYAGRCSTGVWLIEDDGSRLRKLNVPEQPGLFASLEPTWSPTGTEIAHMRTGTGTAGVGIWVTAAHGSSTRELVSAAGAGLEYLGEPVWSPDGRFVAFSGLPADARHVSPGGAREQSIYVVPAVGGPPRRLTAGYFDLQPVFTPDSQRVAFKRNGPPREPRFHSSPVGIMSVPVLGGDPTKLFLGGPLGEPDNLSFSFATAQLGFAPDGRSIAVASLGRVYLASPEGLETRGLTAGTGNGNITLAWAWERRPRLVIAAGTYTSTPESMSIIDVDDPGAPPVALTRNPPGGPAGDAHPDWTSALGEAVVPDLSPPVVELGLGASPAASADGRRKRKRPLRVSRRAIDLRAADVSGIRRIESVFAREEIRGMAARRGRGTRRRTTRRKLVCRFATRRGMSRRRSCRRRITVRHSDLAQWRRMVRRLPRGNYRMRVHVRDVYGRVGGGPARRIVLTR